MSSLDVVWFDAYVTNPGSGSAGSNTALRPRCRPILTGFAYTRVPVLPTARPSESCERATNGLVRAVVFVRYMQVHREPRTRFRQLGTAVTRGGV